MDAPCVGSRLSFWGGTVVDEALDHSHWSVPSIFPEEAQAAGSY